MTPSCITQVTTPTGKFTFHQQTMSVCEAKKACALKGEILAPVTNGADFDALHKVMKEGNHPGCPFHHGDHTYALGLDVTPCGRGRQERIFTNGVRWDENIHGKLYSDYENSRKSNCVFANMETNQDKPAVQPYSDQCYRLYTYRYICLKEAGRSDVPYGGSCASSVPQAVSSDASYHKRFALGAFFICCLSLAAVFFAYVAIKYHRKYRAVEEEKSADVEN